MKNTNRVLAGIFAALITIGSGFGQQPQTSLAPIYATNAKYTNGTAPGYWPTAGSGLTLNLSGGTAFCSGSVVTYSAGTLTMTASTTNYVYLNTASSCVPAVKTSTFVATDIPIATVTTSGSAITAITDVRTMFFQGQLAAQYSKGSCTEVWGGSGTSFALTAGDDAISNNTCYNDSGVTRTITAVKCRNDVASNTVTVNPTFGSAGTGTTILSGALTCGSSLAYSSTGTVSNASWTTGAGITPAMSGTLVGHSIAMIVEYTF